jgi:hypothetical protein
MIDEHLATHTQIVVGVALTGSVDETLTVTAAS